MKAEDFEGSLLLERLAENQLVDQFYAAVDADDLHEVRRILARAGVDAQTIREVLNRIEEGE